MYDIFGIIHQSAPLLFPYSLLAYINIWTRWPRTKKMDWTKCRVTPGSGIFKQTLPWCHGDQEVELTAILADLHLVVCPNLPGEVPGLARNHGLQSQQYRHFPQKKNKKTLTGLEQFTGQTRQAVPNTLGSHISQSPFRLPFFSLWPCQSVASKNLVDPFCKFWRWLT